MSLVGFITKKLKHAFILIYEFQHVHPGRAWKLSSNLHDIYQCWMYSGKLLMMGRGTARNM